MGARLIERRHIAYFNVASTAQPPSETPGELCKGGRHRRCYFFPFPSFSKILSVRSTFLLA